MYECMMHGVLWSGQMTKSLDQPAKKGFEHVGKPFSTQCYGLAVFR